MPGLDKIGGYEALPALNEVMARLVQRQPALAPLYGMPSSTPDITTYGTTFPTGPTGPMGGTPTGGTPYTGPSGPSTPYTGPTTFSPLGGKFPVVDRTPESVPNPSQVTPEIQRVYDEAQARWPGLTNMGTYNVRNVAGTNTPSYHSYGDAVDLGGTPEEMSQFATWAQRHADKLGISQIIYQTSIWTPEEGWHAYSGVPHTNHVHVTGPLSYGDTSPSYPTVNYRPAPKPKPEPTLSKLEVLARRGRQM